MTGEFSYFWSVAVPLVMIAGSIVITYILYRHFAGKIQDQPQESQSEKS
ncbi:MAG: hypothetical protein JW860_10585 [Sedimentisphaerales bacterium]|nr:hypothetical protein [Sedimentisphaerales bacterium]